MAAPKDASHFIALHTADLVGLLCGDPGLAPADREPFREMSDLVRLSYHLRFHRRLIELKTAYAPFDPDSDVTALTRLPAAQQQERLNDLLSDLGWLLDRADFHHLSREEIEPVLDNASDWGIHMDVDFSAFEHVAIFVRGPAYQKRALRSWRTWFQPCEVEVPIYRRLVLILKLRKHPRLGPDVDTRHVFLKIFKDIPRADVDMLLPGARVKLKLIDRGKIGAGLLSGLATMVYRMFAELTTFVRDLVMSDNLALGLAAGCLGYGYKTYHDYHQTRQAYHLSLTQSLYFQNLDSNAGVLTRLIDEAEEQQTRAALLAYFCLWRYAGTEGASAEELGTWMELYLDRHAELILECERGEAARSLLALGLAECCGPDRLRAVPLAPAIERVRETWAGAVPAGQSNERV